MKRSTHLLLGLIMVLFITSCETNDVSREMRRNLTGSWVCETFYQTSGAIVERAPYSLAMGYEQGFKIKRNGTWLAIDKNPDGGYDIRKNEPAGTWDVDEDTNTPILQGEANTSTFEILLMERKKLVLLPIAGSTMPNKFVLEPR